jgi:hypothetical protein
VDQSPSIIRSYPDSMSRNPNVVKIIAFTREGSKKGEQREREKREKETKSNDNSLMIQETSVLLRVEHLQKGASRIPIHPTSSPNLINLVDNNNRVLRAHL